MVKVIEFENMLTSDDQRREFALAAIEAELR